MSTEYGKKISDKGHLMYSVIPDKMAADFKKFLKKYNI